VGLEQNKATVPRSTTRYVGATYTQHNPVVADGAIVRPALIAVEDDEVALRQRVSTFSDWTSTGRSLSTGTCFSELPNEAANANTMF
jgi:hypothetical protein